MIVGIILGVAALLVIAALCFTYAVFRKFFTRLDGDYDAITLRNYDGYDDSGIDTTEMRAGYDWIHSVTAEDHYITSRDGLKLHARFIPAEQPSGRLAVLVHGYRSGINDFGGIYAYYRKNNFDLLIPDQRTHGASEGKYITFGAYERYDIVDWVKYILAQIGERKVLLSGISMGCTTVLLAAAEPDMPHITYLTADCGYTCPRSIFGDVLHAWFGLPPFPFLNFADLICRVFAKFGFHSFDTREAVTKISCPVVFVHGEADDFVALRNTRENFAACTSPEKFLITVPGAGHGLSYIYDKEAIEAKLDEAIKKYF